MNLADEDYDGLMRRVDPSVRRAWLAFVQHCGTDGTVAASAWLHLYKLSVVAYRVGWGGRWRTSEVALLAIHDGCTRPGDLAVAYTHCILVQAVADDLPVFGEGFFV